MRFRYDHDFHIHSNLSTCAKDPLQTKENIFQFAAENGLSAICLTDHFWDSRVQNDTTHYKKMTFERIAQARPLPQSKDISFYFGCETDVDRNMTLGTLPDLFDVFDFLIIPTTHLHLMGLTVAEGECETAEQKAQLWVRRLEAVLNMDLPFHKVGIPHLTCSLIARGNRELYLQSLQMIPSDEMERLFSKAAKLGVGIEINAHDFSFPERETDIILRPFQIAKSVGCRFYCGSDAHTAADLARAPAGFERAIDLLDLKEEHKFHIEAREK